MLNFLDMTFKKTGKYLSTLVIAGLIVIPAMCQEASLKYRLKPGMSFTMESNHHTSIKEHNNIYTISYKYDRLKISTRSAMFVVEIDTKDASNQEDEMMSVLVGKPFTVEMDQYGKILSVRGLEKIFEAVDSIPDIDSLKRVQVKSSFEDSFGEEAFRRTIEQASVFYPAYPVKTGETWNYDFVTTSSNITLIMHNMATLMEAGRNSWLVRINSTIQTPLNDTLSMGGNSGIISMTGKQISEVQISPSNGLLQESNMSQDISGKLTLYDVPETEGDMEIPMKMTTKVTTTLKVK
jgi:hypothetical protein